MSGPKNRRPRRLSAEEARLWAHVVTASGVKPLHNAPGAAASSGAATPAAASPPSLAASVPERMAPDHAHPGDARSLAARPSLRSAAAAPHRHGPPEGGAPGRSHGGAGLIHMTDRRTRRGKREIDGRLDLHGLSQIQARAQLHDFLRRARGRGDHCVLVITGKGLKREAEDPTRPFDMFARSEPGVLRRALPHWLAESDLRAWVSGYAPAHPKHGGAGAFYVFLKRG